MDYYDKYLKYKQKYLALKEQDAFVQSNRVKQKYLALKEQDAFVQSDRIKLKYIALKEQDAFVQSENNTSIILGGKRRSKKNKREIFNELEIKVLKQGIKSDKVLSCSYFTASDAYRKVEKYQKSLIRFLFFKNQFKDFETRIYTDDTTKDFALEISKNDPLVSVYHFNFPPLREKNGVSSGPRGHIGTFGTFVRFLPLFEVGLKIVCVSDIDIPWNYLEQSILSNPIKSNAQFSYRSFVCYENRLYGRSYSILAGTMLSFITFPIEIFNKFLNDLVNPIDKLKKDIEELNKQNKSLFYNYKETRIPYGIDEVFTNQILYNYLILKNIRCYILKDYSYAGVYLRLENLITPAEHELIYNYEYKPTQKNFNELKKVYEKKVPMIIDKHPCLNDMLSNMDKMKTSFVIPLIKTGKELDEELYK